MKVWVALNVAQRDIRKLLGVHQAEAAKQETLALSVDWRKLM